MARRLVLIALLLAALLGNCLSAGLWTRHFDLHGPYIAEHGLAWYVPPKEIAPPIPVLFEIASDTADAPQGADYSVNDADGPLGPAHAVHDEVRNRGEGRYSFWNGSLLFSTRHGEDPNASDLRLRLTGSVRLVAPVLIGLDLLGAIAALLLCLEFACGLAAGPLPLAGLALFVAGFDAVTLARFPPTALYTADTDGYYLLSSPRTAGYGILLRLFDSAFGDLYPLVLVQFAFAALAILFLAAAVRRVFRSPFLALAIGAVLTIKQGLVAQHFALLPDSLFFSCATAALGAALLLLERVSIGRLAVLGVALFAAMALRPAAIGLLPGLGLVPILLWSRSRPAAIGLAALLAASLFANLPAQMAAELMTGRAGAGAGKFSGFVLIGSAGFLLTPQTPTDQPELRDQLVAALAPIRDAWRAAETIEARRQVLIENQDRIIYGHAQPIACHPPPKDCTRAAVNDALRRLSIDAILDDPAGMAAEFVAKADEDATNTLGGDWLVSQENDMAGARASLAGSTVAQGPLAALSWDLTPRAETMAPDPLGLGRLLSDHRALANAAILAAAFASIGWFLVAAARRRLGTEPAAIGLAAIGFLGYHAFVCVLEVPIFRYAEPLAAWYLLSLGGCLLLVLRPIGRRVLRAGLLEAETTT